MSLPLRRGRTGEKAAERELRRRGLTILERNVRAGGGEIDLVALDGETIVIVEVKARSEASLATPGEAVDHRKRGAVVRAARALLGRRGLLDRPRRYDVVSVRLDGKGRAESVTWSPAAFDEGEFE